MCSNYTNFQLLFQFMSFSKNFTKFCYFSKQKSITGYVTSADNTSSREKSIETRSKHLKKVEKTNGLEEITSLTFGGLQSNAGTMLSVLLGSSKKNRENTDTKSRTFDSFSPNNIVSLDPMKTQDKIVELLQTISVTLNNYSISTRANISTLKRWKWSMPISQMNSLFLQSLVSSHSMVRIQSFKNLLVGRGFVCWNFLLFPFIVNRSHNETNQTVHCLSS